MAFEDLITSYDPEDVVSRVEIDRNPIIDFTGAYDSYYAVAPDTPVALTKISSEALEIMYQRAEDKPDRLVTTVDALGVSVCMACAVQKTNGDVELTLNFAGIEFPIPLAVVEEDSLREALKGTGRDGREKVLSFEKDRSDGWDMEL